MWTWTNVKSKSLYCSCNLNCVFTLPSSWKEQNLYLACSKNQRSEKEISSLCVFIVAWISFWSISLCIYAVYHNSRWNKASVTISHMLGCVWKKKQRSAMNIWILYLVTTCTLPSFQKTKSNITSTNMLFSLKSNSIFCQMAIWDGLQVDRHIGWYINQNYPPLPKQ